MVVVAPDGTVFRDDDGGIGNNPLVKIGAPPNNGWYTVQLSHHAGSAVEANFVLLAGLYNGGNPNCAGPTSPSIATFAVDDEFKADSPVTAPKPGWPGSSE